MSNVPLSILKAQDEVAKRQRQKASIASIFIAFLVLALIMLIFALVLLPSWVKEQTVMVSYQMPSVDQEEIQKKTVSQFKSKPSAPSAAMTKVIAANTTSPMAIPVPETEVTEPSLDFGSGDDFGAGWDSGSGDGSGGGGASFFNQKVSAGRVVYVIDYSASMRGKREELMRDELAKSVSKLKPGMQYQMIFFAGPAWVAGDELEFDGGDEQGKTSKEVKVETAEGKKHTIKKKERWKVPTSYNAQWKEATSENLRESRKVIRNHGLIYGTEWSKPLEMAMEMDPAPQIIFFMTDGTGGTVGKVKELASRAKRKQIVINSIAMMMPSTADAMGALAYGTGGVFTIIDEKGRAKKVEPKEGAPKKK